MELRVTPYGTCRLSVLLRCDVECKHGKGGTCVNKYTFLFPEKSWEIKLHKQLCGKDHRAKKMKSVIPVYTWNHNSPFTWKFCTHLQLYFHVYLGEPDFLVKCVVEFLALMRPLIQFSAQSPGIHSNTCYFASASYADDTLNLTWGVCDTLHKEDKFFCIKKGTSVHSWVRIFGWEKGVLSINPVSMIYFYILSN